MCCFCPQAKGGAGAQMWTFQVRFSNTHTHTKLETHGAVIKQMPFEKSPKHSAMVSFNSQRSFHLFILRQEYTDSVCTVSPQIKHSLCIPYEMYLLRFGRGGRQVLGYTKSQGPPFTIRRGWRQAARGEQGSNRKCHDLVFTIKSGNSRAVSLLHK